MDKLARFYREMTDEQKGDLRRILIGGVIFILGEILSHTVPFFMGYGGADSVYPRLGRAGGGGALERAEKHPPRAGV